MLIEKMSRLSKAYEDLSCVVVGHDFVNTVENPPTRDHVIFIGVMLDVLNGLSGAVTGLTRPSGSGGTVLG